MKQAALWLIPAVALASVGSLTYATSRPTIEDGAKKSDAKVVSKIVPFAHDTEIDKYLNSIRSFMLVPPRDGNFGARRVPTFHGTNIGSVPGYKDVAELTKNSSMASFVVGTFPAESLKGLKDYQQANPNQKIEIPTYRTTSIHSFYRNDAKGNQSLNQYQELRKLVEHAKKTVDAKGYETFSESVTVGGAAGFIMSKAVQATDKSCYSCHANIKPGEPIGHVMAAIWRPYKD
jgi:hypothetical protein